MKKLGILLCVLTVAAYCQAAEYEAIDLGTLGGNDSFVSTPRSINEAGQVAGTSYTASGEWHAFLWTPDDGMIDLGTLGGQYSEALAINEAGEVVGYAYTATGECHAFLWTPEADMMIDLGTLGGSRSQAYAINEAGQVVGYSYTPSGDCHPFLWEDANGNGQSDLGEMTDLGSFGGHHSSAYAINETGQVVGYSYTASSEHHAFLWTPGEGMTDLGTLGGVWSYAHAINEAGQVVGWASTATGPIHAFLWEDANGNGQSDPGEMIDLGTLGGERSYAEAINDAGQVVGYSATESGSTHAFLWQDANGNGQSDPGEMIDLGTLTGYVSIASAINDVGQVVGWASTESASHAFLWEDANGNGQSDPGEMIDLGTLGGTYSAASDINEAGQVVGYGYTASGDRHAFLWQPVVLTPEEATLVLVEEVGDLNLQEGIDNSLDAKLDSALNALDDVNQHNDMAAINSLEAFINAVEAQRGKKISEADADALIAAAEEIIFLLLEGM